MIRTGGRRYLIGLAAITAAGAALRFPTLDVQSIWLDEAFTTDLASRPFSGMLDGIRATESSPPGYYVAAWLWAKLFGTGEVGLRSLSALAGTVFVPVAYAAGAALVSRRAGLLAAALAATSPILVWYSQEARPYSLMVLASGLALCFFARSLRSGKALDLAAWAVFSIAAAGIHYFAVFPTIAEAALLVLLRQPRRAALVATAAIASAYVALVPLLREQSGHALWIHDIPLDVRLQQVVRQFVLAAPASPWAGTGTAASGTRQLWLLAVVVLAVALVLAVRMGTARARRGVSVAFAVGATAVLVPLVAGAIAEAAFGRGDYLIERNVLAAWLPLAVVVAGGLGVERLRAAGALAVGLLCAAGLAVVVAVALIPTWQRDDWRAIADDLRGTRVVLVYPPYQARPLTYYDRGYGTADATSVRARELVLVSTQPVPAGAVQLPRSFSEASLRREGNWQLRTLRAPAPAVVPGQPGLLSRPD